MRYAIKITQEILDQNSHNWLNNVFVGDVIIRNDLPTKFWHTKRIGCSYQYKQNLIEADGWKEFKITPFDAFTQKENTNNIVKGFDENDNWTHYTYKIKDLTQDQIDSYLEDFEEQEAGSLDQLNEDEGIRLVKKTKTRLRRRRDKDKININQFKDLKRTFTPIFQQLREGHFDIASEDIEIITFNNVDKQTEVDWLKEKINEYLTTDFNRK